MSDEMQLALLIDELGRIMVANGVAAQRRRDCIAIEGTDLMIAVTAIWDNPDKPPPGVLRSYGVQIGMRGRSLFDETAYEYSYGTGLDDDAAATASLQRWVDLDLPVLLDSAAGTNTRCQLMEITSDGKGVIAAGKWRVFLGPLDYLAGDEGAQPCCQTCLFAMSLEPLMPFVMSKPISSAVKIVASKVGDGETSADCRRNGEDLPEAIAAIAAAAARWPSIAGLQMRRQYLYFKAPARSTP